LPLWAATAHPCRAADAGSGAGPDVDRVVRPISLDEQNEYPAQTKRGHHSPLGSFQHPATWWDRRWPQPARGRGPGCTHAQADQSEDAAEVEMLRLPFAQQGLLLQVRERSGVLLALALPGLSLPGYGRRSLANLWQMAVRGSPGMQEAGCWTRPELMVLGWSPRRNRTSDPILTMEPPGTAVRTAVSPGRARP
jgi:hypothetical protein